MTIANIKLCQNGNIELCENGHIALCPAPAPCTCPCTSWPGNDPDGFPCGGLDYEYVADNGMDSPEGDGYKINFRSTVRENSDMTGAVLRWRETRYASPASMFPLSSCAWISSATVLQERGMHCGGATYGWQTASNVLSEVRLKTTVPCYWWGPRWQGAKKASGLTPAGLYLYEREIIPGNYCGTGTAYYQEWEAFLVTEAAP